MKKFQLINTLYWNKSKNNSKDALIFVLKNEGGDKSIQLIEEPVFSYHVTRDEFDDGKVHGFVDVNKTVKVKCKYNQLINSIVDTLNEPQLKETLQAIYASGDRIGSKLKNFHLHRKLHGSDKNIQDYYIGKLLEKYPSNENDFGTTKVYIDIEVDGSELMGRFPDPESALAPINVITLVSPQNKTVYSFCLDYNNDQVKNIKEKMNNFINELKEKYENGTEKKNEICKDFKYDIRFFDREIDLIKDFFNTINYDLKPDFVLAYNASFDFLTIINRIKKLRYDPETICCPKEFPYKKVNLQIDYKNQDPCETSHVFEISGWSNWLDQMTIFANLRKSAKRDSYALDAIGSEELGEHKDTVEGDISTFHFTNYWKFLLYNIQDTMMLYMLEEKNNDIELLRNISLMTETRISHALKKTVCLRNMFDKIYASKGLVLSNNHSKLFKDFQFQEKIKGALN